MIDSTTTLGDLVTSHPELAVELERLGFDYCCGGERALAESCAELGLDVDAVVAILAVVPPTTEEPAWVSMGVTELVDHIEATHHRYLWDELPRLSALVDKITGVHGDRHRELAAVQRCYEELRADLEPHLMKEERVLFPMIRQLARSDTAPAFHCGRIANPISVMLAEHDRAGELLAELRGLTGGYQTPADGCASYRACYAALADLEADTHLHVHKENNVLFPAVLDLESRLTVPTA
jgi:regulator of cell morphogenesis and NO signaling